jgi:hypothetical protein
MKYYDIRLINHDACHASAFLRCSHDPIAGAKDSYSFKVCMADEAGEVMPQKPEWWQQLGR